MNITVLSRESDKNRSMLRSWVGMIPHGIIPVYEPRQSIALFSGNLRIDNFFDLPQILEFMLKKKSMTSQTLKRVAVSEQWFSSAAKFSALPKTH